MLAMSVMRSMGLDRDSIVFSDTRGNTQPAEFTIAVLHYFDEYDGVPPITDLDVRVKLMIPMA